MNKNNIPTINQYELLGSSPLSPNKGLITKITLAVTLMFLFLVPWGDGIWDGTPRIAATLSLGLALILFLTKGTHKNYTIAHFFFISYFSWQLVSLAWSLDLEYGTQKTITSIQLLLLVFLVSLVFDTKKKMLYAYQAYVLGNITGSFLILYNYLNGIQSQYYGRYGIVNIETDTLSIILALAIPMAAYLATKQSNKLLKLINLFAIPIIFYAIFLTGTRTGSIVGVLGVIYWIFTYRRSSFPVKISIALVMVASAMVIFTFAPKALVERVFSAGESIQSGTLNSRTTIWGGALKQWENAPIIGTGIGGLGVALSKEHINYQGAHNTFIHLLTVTGIVGLSLYLFLFFSLFYYIAHIPFDEKVFLLTLLFCIILSQLTTHTQTEKFIWIILSLVAVHSQKYSRLKVKY